MAFGQWGMDAIGFLGILQENPQATVIMAFGHKSDKLELFVVHNRSLESVSQLHAEQADVGDFQALSGF